MVRLTFDDMADTLVVESSFRAEHYPGDVQQLLLDDYALSLPFQYNDTDAQDLAPYLRVHYDDPDGFVADWMQGFLEANGNHTLDVLNDMVQTVQREFGYQRRDEHGTWAPTTTLANRAGACRDFALLMMEALRTIGVATRFVSGYLYDEAALDQQGGRLVGGGETHAWCEVYLPGAGWVAYDPTNALVAGRNLIPVAFARDPVQVSPLSGGFDGLTGDFLGMTVSVDIARAPSPEVNSSVKCLITCHCFGEVSCASSTSTWSMPPSNRNSTHAATDGFDSKPSARAIRSSKSSRPWAALRWA